MGARIIGEVIAYYVDVPLRANEYSLLVGMALTALDGGHDDYPKARRYFDSREAMCLAIGRRVVDAGTADAAEAAERKSAHEFVRRALNGLLALEAITQEKTGRAGQRAEFRLVLDVMRTRGTTEFRQRVDDAARRRRQAQRNIRKRNAQPHAHAGTASHAHAGTEPHAHAGPKEQLRNNGGIGTGITSRNRTISLGPVDNFGGDELNEYGRIRIDDENKAATVHPTSALCDEGRV